MRMRSGWNAADSSSSSSSSSEEHHRGTEARKELPRGKAMWMLRKSLTEGAGGELRADSCAMRRLLLVYGLRICADFLFRRRIWARIAARWISAMRMLRRSLMEARAEGSCCVGTGAMQTSGARRRRGSCAGSGARMLRRSLTEARRRGGAARGIMRDAEAATGLWATDLRGFPASQAHMGADCCALDQARCCGCDWF